MAKSEKGKLVIISGPSGVGKSTICRAVLERMKNVYLSVSMTTRPKSPKETDGKDYFFVSKTDFKDRIAKGDLLEYAEVFGNYYGTPKSKVLEQLERGRTVILEIDVQGARQVKMKYPDSELIFILPPTQKELAQRMNNRGRGEEPQKAKLRLDQADDEIAAAWQHYDHMVINDVLDHAIDEVMQIIQNVNE